MEGDKFPIGLRVLVVDDDPNQLKILERLLIQCNYEVTVTTDAETALKMLRENKDKFDIFICDVQMPRMGGFKLLELIRLDFNIPVIMLSGDDSKELATKGIRHRDVDCLLKPVSMDAIKNIWQHVVRKGKANSGSDDREDESKDEDSKDQKKRRVVWTPELHKKFVFAMEQLGPEKAFPKKIWTS